MTNELKLKVHRHIVVQLGDHFQTFPKVISQLESHDCGSSFRLPKFYPSHDLATQLADMVVLQTWPYGIHPVIWVLDGGADNLMQSFQLTKQLRDSFSDESLDIVVFSPRADRQRCQELASRLHLVICQSELAVDMVLKHLSNSTTIGCSMQPTRANPDTKVESICFYDREKPCYLFTNFYASRFTCPDDRQSYNTTEHYFQAHKTDNAADFAFIQRAPSAREAFNRARTCPGLKWYWTQQCRCGDIYKEAIMLKGLMLKFSKENRHARHQLLSTGTCQLVEDSPKDPYWGIGADGKGLNRLGYLLEKARAAIFKEEFAARNRPYLSEGTQQSAEEHYRRYQ